MYVLWCGIYHADTELGISNKEQKETIQELIGVGFEPTRVASHC